MHVEHTKPYRKQPLNISNTPELVPTPIDVGGGKIEFKVKSILAHRKRGRGWQFLTLMENEADHDAAWLPTRNFVADDGTITQALLQYTQHHDIELSRTTTKGEEAIVKQRP